MNNVITAVPIAKVRMPFLLYQYASCVTPLYIVLSADYTPELFFAIDTLNALRGNVTVLHCDKGMQHAFKAILNVCDGENTLINWIDDDTFVPHIGSWEARISAATLGICARYSWDGSEFSREDEYKHFGCVRVASHDLAEAVDLPNYEAEAFYDEDLLAALSLNNIGQNMVGNLMFGYHLTSAVVGNNFSYSAVGGNKWWKDE